MCVCVCVCVQEIAKLEKACERLKASKKQAKRKVEELQVSMCVCLRASSFCKIFIPVFVCLSDVILLCTICHEAITSSIRAARHEAAEFHPPISREPVVVKRKPIRPEAPEITGRKLTTPERFNPFSKT